MIKFKIIVYGILNVADLFSVLLNLLLCEIVSTWATKINMLFNKISFLNMSSYDEIISTALK